MKHLLSILLTMAAINGIGQILETVAGPSPRINNGLTIHLNGDIFASDFFGSGFNGNSIHKTTPNGVSTLYASGLSQPAGLAFDPNNLLFVAEFSSNKISTVSQLGVVTTFAAGLNQPSNLVFDSDTLLYVSNYGNGTISKITRNGTVSTYATGLNQPVGLAIDEKDVLYASNLIDGIIYKIDSLGNKDSLTTILDLPIGFMTYSKGSLFITSTGGHKVYRYDINNNVLSTFLGNGIPGTVDGDINTAQFTNPDGIAVSSKGDTIYVSENNSNLLRRITSVSPTNHVKEYRSPLNISASPNPATNYTSISYQIESDIFVKLKLYNETGLLIREVSSPFLQEGLHSFKLKTSNLPVGIYICRIGSNNFYQTTKIAVVR